MPPKMKYSNCLASSGERVCGASGSRMQAFWSERDVTDCLVVFPRVLSFLLFVLVNQSCSLGMILDIDLYSIRHQG